MIDYSNHYDLPSLPAPIEPVSKKDDDSGNINSPTTAYVWSGKFPIPAIGERVFVNMNGFGAGVVESYFVEHGFLGVCVVVDVAPAWHVKQTKGSKYEGKALVFGAELKYKHQR